MTDSTRLHQNRERWLKLKEGGRLVLLCSKCPAESTKTFKPDMPADAIAKFVRPLGWRMDAWCQKPLCPTCAGHGRQEEKKMEQSAEAMRKQFAAYGLLEQYFDKERGAFARGWDDKRIADETSLSQSAVAKVRETMLGPVKIDPVLEEAMAEITEARRQTRADLTELRGLLDTAESAAFDRLAKIDAKVNAAIGARLKVVA